MRIPASAALRTIVLVAIPVLVWAILDRGDEPSADIGGSALGVLLAVSVAFGWGWYDGRGDAAGTAYTRWALVGALMAVTTLLANLLRDGFQPAILIAAPLLGLLLAAPGWGGVALGHRLQRDPGPTAHPTA